MADTPITQYQRVPPPSDPASAQSHLDGELQKLERSVRDTIARLQSLSSTYAPLTSPVLTGDPQAPTPLTADNDTSIATTAFVKAQGYATTTDLTAGLAPKADTSALSAYATTSALTTGLASKEPSVTGSGTSTDYYGGDKAFHALPAQKFKRAYFASTTSVVSVATLAVTTTTPTSTSGTQVLSQSVVVDSTTQSVRIRFTGIGTVNANYMTLMLFSGTTLLNTALNFHANNTPAPDVIEWCFVPGAVGTITISVRAAAGSGTGTFGSTQFGGTVATTLSIEVVEP